MKILSAKKIREADAFTIKHEPISSLDLMERAGERCFRWIYDRAPNLFPGYLDERDYSFKVFCGVGNNGGDGLVIARLLNRNGYDVTVFTVQFSDKCSADFDSNLKRLGKTKIEHKEIKSNSDIPDIPENAIVIDAIFGTGITRRVEGIAGNVIEAINASAAKVVSIDMPSGLFDEDNTKNDRLHVVNADYTLSFQCLKLAFVLGENALHVGECHILDIGLHPDFFEEVETEFFYTEENEIIHLLKPRAKYAHKGNYGHVGLMVGSMGKYGAAVMSCLGALRSGAGLVTSHVPTTGMPILQSAVPEAMAHEQPGMEVLSGKAEIGSYDAIGIGPGIGVDTETQRFFHQVLESSAEKPLVIDADGINILAANKSWWKFLGPNVVLTPHPGEFKRLVGDYKSDFDKLRILQKWAAEHKTFVVLKGAHTAVATPKGSVHFNSTGNPGMATAGSGDVLTGIVASLLAQGYSSEHAAIIGVYLHGKAGDIAVNETGPEAMVATDIIRNLGKAFLSLNLPSKKKH